MRLKDAAQRYHDALATDAYTGEELFKCAFSSFDDHSASGATARRRVLNIPDGVLPPIRSCISIYTEIWLVGLGAADSFGGSVVRRSYGMKRATDLAKVGTPGQAIAGAGATLVYIQKLYFKDVYNTRTESDNGIYWNVFMSPHEAVDTGSFIITPDVSLRVRIAYLPVEGLRVAECDELETGSLLSATFVSNGAYNSTTDEYATTSVTTPVYVVDYNKLYRLHTQADADYQPGDVAVLVPKAALTPVSGSQFAMSGTTWRVLTVQSELDCWLLHARVG